MQSCAEPFLLNNFLFCLAAVWIDAGGDESSAAVCHPGLLTTCCQHRDETRSVTWWFTRLSAPTDTVRLGCYGASSSGEGLNAFLCNGDFNPAEKFTRPVSLFLWHFTVKSVFLVFCNLLTCWRIQFCHKVSVRTLQITEIHLQWSDIMFYYFMTAHIWTVRVVGGPAELGRDSRRKKLTCLQPMPAIRGTQNVLWCAHIDRWPDLALWHRSELIIPTGRINSRRCSLAKGHEGDTGKREGWMGFSAAAVVVVGWQTLLFLCR